MKYLTKMIEAVRENYNSIEKECEETGGVLSIIVSDKSNGTVAHFNIGDPSELTKVRGYVLAKDPTEASRMEASIWLSDNKYDKQYNEGDEFIRTWKVDL